MCLSQPGATVDEERIISISERLTYRHATGGGKAVAGSDDKIVEGIIRMEPRAGPRVAASNIGFAVAYAEIYGNQMAGDLLSGVRKAALAVVLQELNGGLVGTAYPKGAAVQMQNRQLLEPSACAGWIERLGTLKDISKDFFNFTGSHTAVPCESRPLSRTIHPPKIYIRWFSISTPYPPSMSHARRSPGVNKNVTRAAGTVKDKIENTVRSRRP